VRNVGYTHGNKDIEKIKVNWNNLQINAGENDWIWRSSIEGGICEPCSNISSNWDDIRAKFGYTTLSEI